MNNDKDIWNINLKFCKKCKVEVLEEEYCMGCSGLGKNRNEKLRWNFMYHEYAQYTALEIYGSFE